MSRDVKQNGEFMIKFGKSYEIKQSERQCKIRQKVFGVKKFSWLPVQIVTGEYVWLCHYYRYYDGFIDELLDKDKHFKKSYTYVDYLNRDYNHIRINIRLKNFTTKTLTYNEFLEWRILNE